VTIPNLSELLDTLRVGEPYRELLERLLECAGARAADVASEFFTALLEAREHGLPEPETLGLAAARRWLRRQRLDDRLLEPLSLPGDDGKERERELAPLPCPIPASRAQIKWGRGAQHASMPVAPPDADLAAAVRRLPMGERRAIQACFGVGGPKRRGRRSRELLALAERGVAHLRETLCPEHFAANLF
jgi:hypothetical protein